MTDRTSDSQGSVQRSAPVRVSLMIIVSLVREKTHLLFFFTALTVKADVKLKIGITLKGCPAADKF